MPETHNNSQLVHGFILNPRLDANFKALFTQNTPESKGALRAFLTAAIGREVTEVVVVENEPAPEYAGQRGVSFDVNCRFADGEQAQIEMQGANRKYDYGSRAEYHASRLLSSQLVRGEKWNELRKVYQISVLNFTYDRTNKSPVHHYTLCDKADGAVLADITNVIFLELSKIPPVTPEEARNLPAFVKWGIFFKNADNPNKQDVIAELTKTEAGIMQAQRSLNYISEDEKKMYWQWSHDDYERDRLSEIDAYRNEGIAEGSRTAKLEAARNLLAMHLGTVEQIAQASGLTVVEVEQLAAESR